MLAVLQYIMKICSRSLVHLPERYLILLPRPLLGVHGLLRELYSSPLRKSLHSLREIEVLIFHDKCKHVATDSAAEAVIHLFFPVDLK